MASPYSWSKLTLWECLESLQKFLMFLNLLTIAPSNYQSHYSKAPIVLHWLVTTPQYQDWSANFGCRPPCCGIQWVEGANIATHYNIWGATWIMLKSCWILVLSMPIEDTLIIKVIFNTWKVISRWGSVSWLSEQWMTWVYINKTNLCPKFWISSIKLWTI